MKDRNILTLWGCLFVIVIVTILVWSKNNCYVGRLDRVEKCGKCITIMDRINPNTADWASLARLPKIGRVRAQAIVEYREQFNNVSGQARGVAFANADDLQNVKGIGPKTAELIGEYLIFAEP